MISASYPLAVAFIDLLSNRPLCRRIQLIQLRLKRFPKLRPRILLHSRQLHHLHRNLTFNPRPRVNKVNKRIERSLS